MLVFAFLVNVNFAYINCCNFVRPALVSVIVLRPLDNETRKTKLSAAHCFNLIFR